MPDNRKPSTALADRIAACFGKERFADWSRANEVASRHRGRQAYHCPYCRGWHVGRVRKHRLPPKCQAGGF